MVGAVTVRSPVWAPGAVPRILVDGSPPAFRSVLTLLHWRAFCWALRGLLQVSGVLSVQLFPFWSSVLQILSALVFPDSPLHFHPSAWLRLISSSLCCDPEVFSGSKLGQLIVYFAFSSGRVNPLLCLSFIIVLNNLQNFQIPFHFFYIFLFLLFSPPFWSFILIGTLLEHRLPGLQTWFHLPLARKA